MAAHTDAAAGVREGATSRTASQHDAACAVGLGTVILAVLCVYVPKEEDSDQWIKQTPAFVLREVAALQQSAVIRAAGLHF